MKTKSKYVFNPRWRSILLISLGFLLHASVLTLQAGSLWREAISDDRGMFADKRARRVGDILAIRFLSGDGIDVALTTTFTTNRTAGGDPEGLGSRLLNQFIGGVSRAATGKGPGNSKFPGNLLPTPLQSAEQVENPALPYAIIPKSNPTLTSVSPFIDTSGRSSAGENNGTVTYVLSFKKDFIMSAQVIDMLPNGNMILEGSRYIGLGGDRYFCAVRGIARVHDVSMLNEVPSRYVSDLSLEMVPEGNLALMHRKGWLQKFDEKISPW